MALNIFSINNIWSRNKQQHGRIGEVSDSIFLFKHEKKEIFSLDRMYRHEQRYDIIDKPV